jgi:photosystem II stability/assembly factor-like uncharacterized protein
MARLLVGTRKGLITVTRQRGSWRITDCAHRAVPVPIAAADPRDGTLWAALDHGHWGQKLSRSRDGGKTWEEVAAPVYPEDAVMARPWTRAEGPETIPAKLAGIWAIGFGGEDQPGRVYLGTHPGGLFRSDDGGDSFALVRGLWDHPTRMKGWFGGGRDTPGIHSILVDPRDSRHLWVGVSCGGVYESRDDGETWAPRNKGLNADFLPDPAAEVGQDPHLVALCPADPDTLWQQNHCGVYVSRDGAATWEEVSEDEGPVRFGFAVAVDEADPRTAWVVPAVKDEMRVPVDGALCVGRTEDGGRSWTALREGLPQRDCYDLVYRHALDLRGESLAMGSTTGNLFTSTDRGASWTCVSHHLPPIYSVRFAGP